MQEYYYNEYGDNDDYSPSLQLAQSRRKLGREILDRANRFMRDVNRKAEIAGKTPEQILRGMLRSAPHAIAFLRSYVSKRGHTPAESIKDLVTQFAYLRGQHIGEVIDKYDPDNFGFGKAKGKAKRQAKRADRKAKRKAHKGEGLPSVEQNMNPAETEKVADMEQANEADTQAANATEYANTERYRQEQDLINPDESEAHAEILGEEFYGDSFDADKAKDIAPYIAGAMQLGSQIINKAKQKGGISAKQVADLVKNETNQQISEYKKKETKNALRENAPVIAVAVLALLFVGASMK